MKLRQIPGFPGYKAGDDGHIYSFRICGPGSRIDETRTPKRLKASPDGRGHYLGVTLRREGRGVNRTVHSLICEAFHGERPKGLEASHEDGNRKDNTPKNLCWETRAQNLGRRKVHGTDDTGVRNSRALFDSAQVFEIRFMLESGVTASSVAKKFGCDDRLIGKIKRRESYKF